VAISMNAGAALLSMRKIVAAMRALFVGVS
jgi:hypothetical protein